jgi:hypothetical protein
MKIKELLERYHLKTRQSIYNWCNALSLSLAKDSNGHSYATPEQIEKLDQLAEHLNQPGATLTNFTPLSSVSIDTIDTIIDTLIDSQIDIPTDTSLDTVNRILDTPLTESQINAVANLVKAIAQSLKPTGKLYYMTELEQAAASNWILTTAEVRELIGVKPTTHKGEDTYKRGCWLFTKAGKIGSQTAWKVSKQ